MRSVSSSSSARILTSGIGQLDTARIGKLCEQVAHLRGLVIEVILVSSGAVGLGMGRLGLEMRPEDLASLQACAAVGQSILINTWQKEFDPHGLTVAQILLTREDLRAKHRHNAVFNTVEQLLSKGVVPIVNENDTVSAAEIKFGDNDARALVASVTNSNHSSSSPTYLVSSTWLGRAKSLHESRRSLQISKQWLKERLRQLQSAEWLASYRPQKPRTARAAESSLAVDATTSYSTAS